MSLERDYGLSALKRGEFDLAIEYLEQARKQNPLDFQVLYYLGGAYHQTKHDAEAANALAQAATLQPYHAHVYYNLAISLDRLQRRDEAIAAIERALKLQPDYALARKVLKKWQKATNPAPANAEGEAKTEGEKGRRGEGETKQETDNPKSTIDNRQSTIDAEPPGQAEGHELVPLHDHRLGDSPTEERLTEGPTDEDSLLPNPWSHGGDENDDPHLSPPRIEEEPDSQGDVNSIDFSHSDLENFPDLGPQILPVPEHAPLISTASRPQDGWPQALQADNSLPGQTEDAGLVRYSPELPVDLHSNGPIPFSDPIDSKARPAAKARKRSSPQSAARRQSPTPILGNKEQGIGDSPEGEKGRRGEEETKQQGKREEGRGKRRQAEPSKILNPISKIEAEEEIVPSELAVPALLIPEVIQQQEAAPLQESSTLLQVQPDVLQEEVASPPKEEIASPEAPVIADVDQIAPTQKLNPELAASAEETARQPRPPHRKYREARQLAPGRRNATDYAYSDPYAEAGSTLKMALLSLLPICLILGLERAQHPLPIYLTLVLLPISFFLGPLAVGSAVSIWRWAATHPYWDGGRLVLASIVIGSLATLLAIAKLGYLIAVLVRP